MTSTHKWLALSALWISQIFILSYILEFLGTLFSESNIEPIFKFMIIVAVLAVPVKATYSIANAPGPNATIVYDEDEEEEDFF